MTYKVISLDTNECLSDESNTSIILKPDGRIAYNDYGDEIGIQNCVVIFFPREGNNSSYIDEVGGIHEEGCGWDPNGRPCGECSRISCKICKVWKETID